MGAMFRRRRPAMRLAAGAATAGVAYRAGKRHAGEAAADDAEPQPPEDTSAEASGGDAVGDLDRLVKMHDSGDLSDEEFASAKASLLGL